MPPIRIAPVWELNFNTLVSIGGAFIIGASVWFGLRGDVQNLLDWRATHETENKERRAVNDAALARQTAMISALDERLDAQEAFGTRMADRQAANEARSAELAQSLRELQASINQQSRDLSVILSWIDEQRRKTGERK